MVGRAGRSTEALVVSLYAAVAVFAGSIFLAVRWSNGPYIGGAFLVIGAFWVSVVTAIAMSLTVLIVNAGRLRRNGEPDLWTSSLAVVVLVALGLALPIGFVANSFTISFFLGGIGFILVPAAMLVRVLDLRIVDSLRRRTSIRERTK